MSKALHRFPYMHLELSGCPAGLNKEIQELRANIYQLEGYLRETGLPHALAHPFLSSNWRLDAVTMEKALVLFPIPAIP